MIQFNLLPDVKLEYVKAKRNKRLIITAAIIVMVACGTILAVISGAVYGIQRGHISNLDEDIAEYTEDIKNIDEINRILTVQNQLNTITSLHEDKPVVSRLFSFVETITPSDVSINRIEVNFENESIILSGQADTLATVNKFVDTIKFTNYSIDSDDDADSQGAVSSTEESTEDERAFFDVVLSSFGRTNDETSYTIELSFNPIIFDSTQDVSLELIQRITTRSEVQRPQALFRTPEETNNGEQ